MEAIVPVDESGEGIVVVCAVVCIADVCLKEVLHRNIPVEQLCHPDRLAGNTEIYSFIFLRRKIGVEHIGKSDSVHGGTCYVAMCLQTVGLRL